MLHDIAIVKDMLGETPAYLRGSLARAHAACALCKLRKHLLMSIITG
jgi:hypothetical protein